MKKLLLFLFLIAAFCLPPLASSQITPRKEQQNPQTLYKDQANTYSGGGRQDFGNVIIALPGSTTPPATCAVRDVYIDTDAAIGSRFLLCTATNTWTAIDNPFGLTIDDSEIPAGIARDSEITLPNLAGGASGANDYDYGGATALRLKVGSGTPPSGDCDAAGEVGRIYARTDANGTNATLYVCSKTSATPTYAWELTQGAGGGGSMTFLGLTDTPASYVNQAGKLAAVNGAETAVEFTDPIVSFNYSTLLNAVAATGSSTGSAVRLSTLGAIGTLYITGAGITGSPSGCQIQLINTTNLGGSINNVAVAFTPATSTQSFAVTPAVALQSSDQMSGTYTCSVYPSAGTLSVVFSQGQIDFATQTTLALIKTAIDSIKTDVDKIPASPSTETTLALIKTAIDSIKTDVDKIPASPATEGGNLATIAAKDFATQTTLALIKAKTDNLDAAISLLLTLSDFDTKTGSLTETAPATDTASSGLNGRLQRIAQRLTSLIALLPAALGAGGGLKVDGSGTALPTSLASIPDSSGQGATGDAAATVGSTGSLSAKLRLITSQLDAITTSVQLIDNMISGSGVNVSQINGVAPLMGNGVTGTGSPRVTIASDNTTLTNTFGNVGEVPITSGGTAIFRRVSTADTNIANVKASAGQVYQIVASNVNAAARYIHLYNTSGSPTCNTSIISTFIIPGGGTSGGGTNIPLPPGAAFGTGIGICITTAVDGTGSVAANEIVLNIFYK